MRVWCLLNRCRIRSMRISVMMFIMFVISWLLNLIMLWMFCILMMGISDLGVYRGYLV